MTGFIAIVRTGSPTECPGLLAAGATAVLSWDELATSTAADDVPAVLIDQPAPAGGLVGRPELSGEPGVSELFGAAEEATDLGQLGTDLAAVLATLTSVDPADPEAGAPDQARSTDAVAVGADRNVVIATVRPVIDTLKLVDATGVLTGTAPRDDHRFVGTPIAARLRVLRAVSGDLADPDPARSGPTAVAVLTALVERGATVFASSHQSPS
jgi:hypothetical protein